MRRSVLLIAAFAIALPEFVPEFVQGDCTVTNLGIVPLPDLGPGLYRGFPGGLYLDGLNSRPATHEAAGIDIATNEILPRDAAGMLDTNTGKIVILSIGMSNTTQEWASKGTGNFKRLADADPSKNPQLVIVDGAQGGQPAGSWTNINAPTWWVIETNRLRAAGVTTQQVQILWLKQAHPGPSSAFPQHAQNLQRDLERILRNAKTRYPNLKIAYLSSRIRAYVTNQGSLNPEPQAFESAFSVRWAIEKQLNGAPELNFDSGRGAVVAPWLSWGPYLWADGTRPRSDGFTWVCADLESDFTHPSAGGAVPKVAKQLLAFFKTDPTATPWFLRRVIVGQPPVSSPTVSTNRGPVPLAVTFAANASDPDGLIRDYQWTFEDGTFATNANPVKTFPAPGTYRVRLTVTDNSGNAVTNGLTVLAGFVGSSLRNPRYTNNVFRFEVIGPQNVANIVEGSSDFQQWTPLQTNEAPFIFSEPARTSNRFYRAVAQ